MLFIPCDNWKTLFFPKVCRYFEICSIAVIVVFFEASVLKELRILRYLHNYRAALILQLQNKAIVFYTKANVFYTLYFLTVPHFST